MLELEKVAKIDLYISDRDYIITWEVSAIILILISLCCQFVKSECDITKHLYMEISQDKFVRLITLSIKYLFK